MKRRKFLTIAGSTIVIAGVSYYLLSDKSNFVRADTKQDDKATISIKPEETEILFLASLAPSGHNTQPWFVKYMEPFKWIVCNDKTRWLPAVDPMQRETVLSIGAFLQNLEYAANSFGYNCVFNTLAVQNQDENMVEVRLDKKSGVQKYDVEKIKHRRTVRSNYLNEILNKEDVSYLIKNETDSIHYIPNSSKEHQWLNEQTIEANRIQSYRDAAQNELANWIRFSGKDAEKHNDGLTLAGMEIEGIPGWYLRNFYNKADVLKKSFRQQSIDKVVKQVSNSAGWILITSKDDSVTALLETGKRMQRLFLKVREKGIAIHPMTQVIEETSTTQLLNKAIGLNDPVQFILRTGYLKDYPEPVTLRRSVARFVIA
ncbi:MAG: nitroreductase family protein [Ferruginibacter sp.]|nr:nitroreductase family protein [Ferruginibacter sp.]